MKEVYYIPYTKEQFIESITDSIKKYKHPWFSMRISFKKNSFIITPDITLMLRNPFGPRYVGKIFEESSGIKIIGVYKMMFIVKLILIISVLGLIIEVITGNISKEEILIVLAFFAVLAVFYLIPKYACKKFLKTYFSNLATDVTKNDEV